MSDDEATVWIQYFTSIYATIKLNVSILLIVSLAYFIYVTWAVLEERDSNNY